MSLCRKASCCSRQRTGTRADHSCRNASRISACVRCCRRCGFVLPGLRVDVLVTGSPTGSEGTVTTTCLQNMLVFSAGQTIQPDGRGQAINTPTVTLLVTPEQAETLTLAGNEGRIQLVLRNSSDQAMRENSWNRRQGSI